MLMAGPILPRARHAVGAAVHMHDNLLCLIQKKTRLAAGSEANADFVTLTMSAVKLSSSTPDDGETGLKRTYSFTAFFNSAGGAALANHATTIQVQDSAA